MDREAIQSELVKKGSDLNRLLAWLQQPKQGILRDVALVVLEEVCQEFKEGKQWYLESLMYEPGYQKLMAKAKIPEVFWVEMYILERCRWAQEDVFLQTGTSVDPFGLIKVLKQIDGSLYELLKPIRQRRETFRLNDPGAWGKGTAGWGEEGYE